MSVTIAGATYAGGPNAFGSVSVNKQMNQVTGTGIIPAGCFGGGKG